jgi:carbonic anhydrase
MNSVNKKMGQHLEVQTPEILLHSTIVAVVFFLSFITFDLLTFGDVRRVSLLFGCFISFNVILLHFWILGTPSEAKIWMNRLGVLSQWTYVAFYLSTLKMVQVSRLDRDILLATLVLAMGVLFLWLKWTRSIWTSFSFLAGVSMVMTTILIWNGVTTWSIAIKFQPSLVQSRTHDPDAKSAQTILPSTTVSNSDFSGGQLRERWAYRGEFGPEMWGLLSQDFKNCSSGKSQSPVDIPKHSPVMEHGLETGWTFLKGSWDLQKQEMKYNIFTPASSIIGNETYILKSVSFHTPSEHQISGLTFPMEIEFVHQSKGGRWSMLSTMVEMGQQNPQFDKLISSLDAANSKQNSDPIDFSTLVPINKSVFRYTGSLTVPPCTEGVQWNVFQQSIELSREQINAFRSKSPMNSRPIQNLGGRMFEGSMAVAH